MRILVLNASNTLNYGSMMMLENLVYHTAREYGKTDLTFVVPSADPEGSQDRLNRALGQWARHVRAVEVRAETSNRPLRVLRRVAASAGAATRWPLQELARSCDAVVVLGGDDYTEEYGRSGPLRRLLQLNVFRRVGLPVLMLSQTIGPFSSWREHVARGLLKSVSAILAREPNTFDYLTKRLLLERVEYGADLALLPLAGESVPFKSSIPGNYITLVPSELIWRYTHKPDRDDYISHMAELCKSLLDRLPDDRLVILPHVLAPAGVDDRLVSRDLDSLLRKQYPSYAGRVVYKKDPLLPYEARAILHGSRFVVAGRMHSAVSALVGGVPPISMAYGRKYDGILGRQFGLQELIVDVSGGRWPDIHHKLLRSMEVLLDCFYDLKNKISESLREIEPLARGNIAAVLRTIRIA